MPPTEHDHWMQRCLQLAALGGGNAAPNPMVGAVLVQGDRVLAEGWHTKAGAPHAEVECLRAFGDRAVPDNAVLYVNLEPCAHHGRTPPCADLLIARNIKHVVIGQRDPFPGVAGKGIQRLKEAGVDVVEDVLHDACRWAQRRFLTSVENGRAYIILKWARSADGFLDQRPRTARGVQRISSPATDTRVHQWRSQEQAILVGSRTVLNDDPSLTVRHVDGPQPLRIVVDRKGVTPAASALYSSSAPTLLITGQYREELSVEQLVVSPSDDPILSLLDALQTRLIRSVIVEGGAELLNHFIQRQLWDEARIITGGVHFGQGTEAPALQLPANWTTNAGVDRIDVVVNTNSPSYPNRPKDPSWHW